MWLGAGIAVVVSVGFIYPAVRLRGLFLAFATLAFLVAIQIFMLNWFIVIYDPANPTMPKYIGGAVGAFVPLKPESLIDFQWHEHKLPYVYLIYLFVAVEIILIRRLMNSKTGYYLRAIRDDDLAAEHVGINTVRYKLLSVAISAVLCALSGTFYAQYVLFVEPISTINQQLMFFTILSTMMGGIGTLLGPLIGSMVYVPTQMFLTTTIGTTRYSSIAIVILGLILIGVTLPLPQGIYGKLKEIYAERMALSEQEQSE
jgi:branched-chain amino acid transport system permease protein